MYGSRSYSSINSSVISAILIFTYSDIFIRVTRETFFHVKAGKLCAMAGEVTVYNEFDKFKGSGEGCNTPCVNNPVAANGDSSSVRVFFFLAYLAQKCF